MLLMAGCSVDSGFDTTTPQETQEQKLPNMTPASGKAIVVTTSTDSAYALRVDTVSVFTGTNMAPTTIQIDPSVRYQSMDGFGFAMTYSSAYNLMQMPQDKREAFLKRTFSTTEGYGVSYLRMCIGCSDFSSRQYTLCDKQGLENFALQSDETDYIIPIMKEVLAINPDVKVIAAPWTCPGWMKLDDNLSGAHNSYIDGRLNPEYRATYAQYFVKFIQAMQQQGINIYAVSPQNEPLNKGNVASTYMPWSDEALFVKELAKAFHDNGLTTKIYVFDHNYDFDGISSQQNYPIKVYQALGDNYAGSELVVGSAWHNYSGTPSALESIYSQAPDKEIIFTESTIADRNEGDRIDKQLMDNMRDVMFGTVNRMAKAVLVWNFMLDSNDGPYTENGPTDCLGAVEIDKADYQTVTYHTQYFQICHMSSVVKPGAVRVGTSRLPDNTGNMYHSEFVNPDGTYAAVLENNNEDAQTITFSNGSKYVTVTVPAYGIVSVRW